MTRSGVRWMAGAIACMGCAGLLLTCYGNDTSGIGAETIHVDSVMHSLNPDYAEANEKPAHASRRKPVPAASVKDAKPKTPFGQNAAEYVLTFSEDFDQLRYKLWNDHIWYESSNRTVNYMVDDGMLKIWPERDDNGKFFNRTLDTDGRFSQTYGYFEMEARLPRGKGTWPAFWLFAHPGKRRPEIDIMEAYAGGTTPWGITDSDGVPHPRAYGTTIWLDAGNSAGFRQHDMRRDLSAGFHKYALKWEPDRQTFYFDGKQVLAVDVSMSDPMYLILNLWFGSESGTPDDSTPQGKSNAYEINYVRAWQFK